MRPTLQLEDPRVCEVAPRSIGRIEIGRMLMAGALKRAVNNSLARFESRSRGTAFADLDEKTSAALDNPSAEIVTYEMVTSMSGWDTAKVVGGGGA